MRIKWTKSAHGKEFMPASIRDEEITYNLCSRLSKFASLTAFDSRARAINCSEDTSTVKCAKETLRAVSKEHLDHLQTPTDIFRSQLGSFVFIKNMPFIRFNSILFAPLLADPSHLSHFTNSQLRRFRTAASLKHMRRKDYRARLFRIDYHAVVRHLRQRRDRRAASSP